MGTGYCLVRSVRFRDSVHSDTDAVRNSSRHHWKKAYNIWYNLMKIWFRFSKELITTQITHISDINFSEFDADSVKFYMVLNYIAEKVPIYPAQLLCCNTTEFVNFSAALTLRRQEQRHISYHSEEEQI